MITPSSLAEMDLEDTYLLASPKLQNKYHKKKSHKKAPKEIAKAAYDVNLNPSDQQKPIDSQQQQQQPSPSEDIDSLDYKKMEQKIHCCLSSTYYHIPPNTIVNECSSETCYYENRELMAQQLVHKLSYYLIAYRWTKRGVQLGFLVGIYYLSRKLWKSDYFWQWAKNECQERVILLCLKGQIHWVDYLLGKITTMEEEEQLLETLRFIRKREKRVRSVRNQRKKEGLTGEELMQLKSKKGLGSTTALTEIKELTNMIFLENSFRILEQYKDKMIEWYDRGLKTSVFKIRNWDDFTVQMNLLLSTMKNYLFYLFGVLKMYWNPVLFQRFIKSVHLIKWWNEKMIFIRTYLQLAMNRSPMIQ